MTACNIADGDVETIVSGMMAAQTKTKASDEAKPEVNPATLAGLTELVLKDPGRLDSLGRTRSWQSEFVPRYLAIGLISFVTFGLALAFLINLSPPTVRPHVIALRWETHPAAAALSLCLAYVLGFVAASGICLPSFYFYGLLAGVKADLLQVTTQIMKAKAATAILLLGLLPIYVALVMGEIIFHFPEEHVRNTLTFGLLLPFLAGLWGVWSLYVGFTGLADTIDSSRRCQRECLLRRLTLACSGCYTAVCPVMIYTLWDYFNNILAGQAG
jgi:hypothetical protein